MKGLEAARERIAGAASLPEVLDASYRAFAVMLRVIQREQDRGGPLFAAFVMSGQPAASGRLALLTAPSLPASTPLSPDGDSGDPGVTGEHAAETVAWLSLILACRLDDQAASAGNAEDRDACVEAARHAWAVHARLS